MWQPCQHSTHVIKITHGNGNQQRTSVRSLLPGNKGYSLRPKAGSSSSTKGMMIRCCAWHVCSRLCRRRTAGNAQMTPHTFSRDSTPTQSRSALRPTSVNNPPWRQVRHRKRPARRRAYMPRHVVRRDPIWEHLHAAGGAQQHQELGAACAARQPYRPPTGRAAPPAGAPASGPASALQERRDRGAQQRRAARRLRLGPRRRVDERVAVRVHALLDLPQQLIRRHCNCMRSRLLACSPAEASPLPHPRVSRKVNAVGTCPLVSYTWGKTSQAKSAGYGNPP